MIPAVPRPADRRFGAWKSATDAMTVAGVLIDCAPLGSDSATTTVRVRDGETLLTDGPAAELKEQVGGYTLVERGGDRRPPRR